ncbi:MAG: hypothetical protein ABI992_10380, partial [Chthoniobacterales bacterium]
QDYIKQTDPEFSAQLTTFKNTIPDYAVVTGVTGAQTTSQAADADYFADCLEWQSMTKNSAQQATSWKDLIRNGGTPPASGAPVALKLPPGTPVAPGIEPRFRALCQQIKASPEVNESILEALGIIGPEQTGPDYATLKPAITATINGTAVDVGWNWGGYRQFLSMCELQIDRDDGAGWVLLAMDTTPGNTDTHPFPAKPAKWQYRAIYHAGDSRVGEWSNPVSVTVGG